MRMCFPHWDKLKDAMKVHGIDHLIKTQEVIAEGIENEILGNEGKAEQYDPLWSANWLIMGRAIETGGIYLLTAPPEGEGWVDKDGIRDFCPICEAIKHRPVGVEEALVEDYWINGPTKACVIRARDLGLIPTQ